MTSTEPPTDHRSGAAPRSVLVVDDDPGIRLFVRRVVERHGHRCAEAASGEEALRMAAEQETDLALVDLNLPGMPGETVVAHLAEALPDLPVVVMSGHHPDDVAQRLGAVHTDGLLTKPFTMEALAEVVEAVGRGSAG